MHVATCCVFYSSGISSDTVVRPSSVSQEELLELIDKMNRDWRVSGLLVQLPLPGKHSGCGIDISDIPHHQLLFMALWFRVQFEMIPCYYEYIYKEFKFLRDL